MKLGGKKIPRGNLLLYLSFTAISLCFLLIISAINTQNKNRLGQNNMYSGHQKEFYIMCSDNEAQWDEVIPKLRGKHDDFALYVTVPDQRISIRGIYINGEIDNPPMIRGKYFDDGTSWTEKPSIVIGKEFEDGIITRDETMYYMLNGVEYNVLGVMGTEYESRLNHIVLIDFKSAVELIGINTDYILDTRVSEDINKVGYDIDKSFSGLADVIILLGEGMPRPFINRMLASDMIMNTLYIMILISFSLSTILVTFIWLRFRDRLFFVFSLCGYVRKLECLEISKRFYLISGTGFVSGLIMIYLIMMLIPDIHITTIDIVVSFATTIILGSFILFFSYFNYLRKRRKA